MGNRKDGPKRAARLVILLLVINSGLLFGASWSELNSGVASLDVRVIKVDPVRQSTVYAGGGYGVSKSTNEGVFWLNTPYIGPGVTIGLVIDSVDPNILYAATAYTEGCSYTDGFRLFKSTDGGASWNSTNGPDLVGCENIINLLGIDPTDANILYVGTKGFEFPHALLKSTNGGASWHYASGPYPFDVMVIDPLNPNTLYAGSKLETDVLASTDGANSWHATGLKSTGVSMLAIDSKNPTTIYAGTVTSSYYDGLRFQGLFKSTDRGEVGGLSMTVCLI